MFELRPLGGDPWDLSYLLASSRWEFSTHRLLGMVGEDGC